MKYALFMAKDVDFKSIFIFTVKLKVIIEFKHLCKGHIVCRGNQMATTEKMQINSSR